MSKSQLTNRASNSTSVIYISIHTGLTRQRGDAGMLFTRPAEFLLACCDQAMDLVIPVNICSE